MIVDLWVLAVLVEVVLLSLGGLAWVIRARPTVVTVVETVQVPAPAHEATPTHDAHAPPPPPPPDDDGIQRTSFWEQVGEPPPADAPAAAAPAEDVIEAAPAPPPPPPSAPPPPPVPTAVFLEPSDIEAAMASAGAGFGADDLMQLQDVVSSTETKLLREAKSLDALLERLSAEAKAIQAASAAVKSILETEEVSADVRAQLEQAAPALASTSAALGDATPDLEDLRSSLRAMSAGMTSYTKQEWVPRQPTADGLNARIRSKLEQMLMG